MVWRKASAGCQRSSRIERLLKGVGFATAGTHEALTYLGIVKKVIEKTERIVAKKNLVSVNGDRRASPSYGRPSIGNRNGCPTEGCGGYKERMQLTGFQNF